MIAVKAFSGVLLAASAMLAGPAPAQAEEPPCAAGECEQAPRPAQSIYPRHNYACMRGVCVPLPAPRPKH